MSMKNAIKKIYNVQPDILKRVALFATSEYKKAYYYTKSYLSHNRQSTAYVDPFQIYWISPDAIEQYSTTRFGSRKGPIIKGGSWDTTLEPFDERPVFESFVQRFVHGDSWSETPSYDRLKNKYGTVDKLMQKEKYGKFIKDLEQVDGIEDGLKKYDMMHVDMKQEGYKTQRELRSVSDRLRKPWIPANGVPEYDEINVDVSRSGEFIWFHGQHRLALAKILGIERIPVRIRCRHKLWQKKRERAAINPDSVPESLISHVDIPVVE